MKIHHYGFAALLCLMALWGAAHSGLMPATATDGASDLRSVTAAHGKPPELLRYLPIIR
jgi:hypothetical protein